MAEESLKATEASVVDRAMHPPRWRIRFSSNNEAGFVACGMIADRIEASALWARRWDSREGAVAHVLRYIDAKIVSSVDQLSASEPTVFIEEITP